MWRQAGARLSLVARQSLQRSRSAALPAWNSLVAESAPAGAGRSVTDRLVHSGWLSQTPFALRAASPAVATKDLSDELEHATGLEREELAAELEGKERFEVEPPRGPFGTEDAPAIVEAQFDERLVGCSGGVGEEEHDVVWFKLSKDSNHSCSVCSQVFKLKVVGPGGIPGHHH
ncbi:unnamed protein product [Closterium sp. NIES-53]